MKRPFAIIMSLLFIGLVFFASAQDGESSTDSIAPITAEQVERGKEAYTSHCATCHMANLQGDTFALPLTGAAFYGYWQGRSAQELFDIMHSTMPLGRPASLPEQTYVDIIAYVMEFNGYETSEEGELTLENVADVEFDFPGASN